MAFWDSALAQSGRLWGGLSAAQRAVFLAVAAALAAGFAALVFWAGSPDYAVLYGRLSVDDAAQVVERLQGAGVPYRLQDGGRTVMVPSGRVYDLRLQLAGEGVPQGGVVGFEIFDQSGFGMTDFAQKVNFTRALEGELTRTIRRLEGVEGARVHLVLPERRLFESEQQPATASVVLQLGSGRRLGGKQIQGVVYLVASSVQGLEPGAVTVVDTQGNVLYQASGDEPGLLAASQLEYKRAYEKEAERRVREMLERVLGSGAAVVQVSARFDFDRVEETSEVFDPEAVAVRSEERQSESSTGPGGPAGVPGVAANVAGAGPEAGTGAGSSTRETETVNYEVSKRVTRVQRTPGALTRLTAAVAVDGTYREGADGAKEFVPRGAEELSRLRSLVEKAVGFDAARGDEVEVTSIPFRPAEVLDEPRGLWGPELLSSLIRYGAVAFVALLLVAGVARPLLRWLGSASRGPEVTGPVTVAELERQLAAEGAGQPFALDETTPSETMKREALKKRLSEMVQTEPEVAAQLIRSWMTEE
ncbi:MAG: flagellar basal-body MS-ring/collar protein FliF [Thermodesulfobacteriota bacterium]